MKKLFLILNLLFVAYTLEAQERPIAFDHNNTLFEITPAHERYLKLFPEHKTLHSATLYQVDSNLFSLEIYFDSSGIALRERRKLDPIQLNELRNTVTDYLTVSQTSIRKNHEGRQSLLTTSSAVGLAFYGWAFPAMAEFTDVRANVGSYMLISGSSFLAPFLLTKNAHVTKADAKLFAHGQTRGILHGYQLAHLSAKDPGINRQLGYAVAGSMLGATTGYLWSRMENMNLGRATAISAYGDFGIMFGYAAAHASGMFTETTPQRNTLFALGGSGIGLLTGALTTKPGIYSHGDALHLRACGHLGAFLPFAITNIIEPLHTETYSIAGMAGGALGLYIGHQLAGKTNLNVSQGVYLNLSQWAGGLVGAGIGFLGTANMENVKTNALVGSMIGAVGAHTFLLRHYTRNHQKTKSTRTACLDLNLFPTFVQGPGLGMSGVPTKSHPGFGMFMKF